MSDFQRARSEVFAVVRLDPLAFSGDKRRRSKALFFAVRNGTSHFQIQNLSIFSCDPDNWAYGQATAESTAKDITSARISCAARAAVVPLLDWLPACVALDFVILDPDALGDDSSFFAVTQQ